MIAALDIETIPNMDITDLLPEPSIDSRLKDPAKIAEAEANAKQKQIDSMALDPLTGRVLCFALANDDAQYERIIEEPTDAAETVLLQDVFSTLGNPECRLATWNGIGFDLPYIYKRAVVLGIDPANFGAPPLTTWTARYKTDRHYDLMQIWGGWRDFVKLDTVASLMMGERKTEGIDVKTFIEQMKTKEGRIEIQDYCMQDTKLTWRLFERMLGTLFV